MNVKYRQDRGVGVFEEVKLQESKIFAFDSKDEGTILAVQFTSELHPWGFYEMEIDINKIEDFVNDIELTSHNFEQNLYY